MPALPRRLHAFLRWTEQYTKTDMVYLLAAGFWTNLGVIIQAFLGLALSIALANLLAPGEYGLYQYLLALSLLVAAVSLPGMNSAVAQATARGYEGVLKAAVRAQFKWLVIPTSLALFVALYYFLQDNGELAIGLVAIAIVTPIANAFNTYVGLFEGRRDFRRLFTLGTAVMVASYASVFIAVIWTRSAAALITVNLGVNAIAMAWAYYRTIRAHAPNGRIDPDAVSYGRHLSVMAGFTTIMSQVDSVLVFHFLGAAELAVYSLATLLPERIGTLFNFIGVASMPKFAAQSVPDIRAHLFSKILRLAVAGIAVAILYALFAPFIFDLLFPAYGSAVAYSQVYGPVVALLAIATMANTVLYAKRFTREIYIVSFVQPILLVGLQIPLLLLYGIWGMIAARLVSDLVGIGLALVLIFKPFTRLTEERE